jgi:hypothetical protein
MSKTTPCKIHVMAMVSCHKHPCLMPMSGCVKCEYYKGVVPDDKSDMVVRCGYRRPGFIHPLYGDYVKGDDEK